jgi:ribosomal protein S18 acetylase RimI-like enzyme
MGKGSESSDGGGQILCAAVEPALVADLMDVVAHREEAEHVRSLARCASMLVTAGITDSRVRDRLADRSASIRPVGIREAGAINLAGFVRATAGRKGVSADVRGGVAVAGPVAVLHGYVDAAIPTDLTVPASVFVEESISFFESAGRAFVLWVPSSSEAHRAEAFARHFEPTGDPMPAMVATKRVASERCLRVDRAHGDEAFAVVGDLCERGYEQPGMAWLMSHQGSCLAPDSYWHIAFDGDVPVSAACGFRTGDTGGIYSVATPPELRGRGFAAAVTSAATNRMFDLGVSHVVLQASKLGVRVYERLGFTSYDHFERFTVSFTPPPT